MKNQFNLIQIPLLFMLFIPMFSFSQANDVKKLYSFFEEKKWDDFEKKYYEIVTEHKLNFDPVVKYEGVINDGKFDVFKKTDSRISLPKHDLKSNESLRDKYREILILSYMRILKSIELKDSSLYSSLIPLSRNSYFLTILEVNNCEEVSLGNVYSSNDISGLTKRDCAYKKPLNRLGITEVSCLQLIKSCDSLFIEFINSKKNSTSSELIGLRSKLNCSTFYPQIDKYIQTKEEDEAIASKDLKTIVQILNKYPNSTRRAELLIYYDDFFFEYARSQGTIEVYKDYIKNLPKGKYIQQVSSSLEDLYFAKAINSNDVNWIKQVISAYPNNEKVKQLQYRIEELEYELASKEEIYTEEEKAQIAFGMDVKTSRTKFSGYEDFIIKYPTSPFTIKAKQAIRNMQIENAIESKNIQVLKSIIANDPSHANITLIKTIVQDAETRALKLSTYTGNYFDGKSTYEYYVNTEGDRVIHGKFHFKRDHYDYDDSPTKLNFLDIANFPLLNNPKSGLGENYDEDDYNGQFKYDVRMSEFIWFLGQTPVGSFTGTYKHGKKDGIWKYEYYNEHTYNIEVMTLNLKNDSLISATYSITNKKYKLPANCLACNEINLTIKPHGFEGEYYSANGSDYVTGNYVNGERDGIWRQYVKYYDPENDPEAINFDAETFPADITSVYSNGKLVSQKIRNQETGQIMKQSE